MLSNAPQDSVTKSTSNPIASPGRGTRILRVIHGRDARATLSSCIRIIVLASQSNLYRKAKPPSSINFLNKFADSLVQAVPSAPEGSELLVLASRNHGIVETPMQALCGAGKDGTSLVRVITYGDHVIEFIIEKLVRRL